MDTYTFARKSYLKSRQGFVSKFSIDENYQTIKVALALTLIIIAIIYG